MGSTCLAGGRPDESSGRAADARDNRPGDTVTWRLPSSQPHIGIVGHERSAEGARLLVIHNIGAGPALDDILFAYEITGHYHYEGPD